MAHRVLVLFPLHEESVHLELSHDLLPGDESVEAEQRGGDPARRAGALGHRAFGREDHGHRQAMPLAHVEIVCVMRRRDLQRPGPEGRVDVAIGDYRDLHIGDGQSQTRSHEVAIALVLRVHGNGDIGKHRLRPRCGNRHAR